MPVNKGLTFSMPPMMHLRPCRQGRSCSSRNDLQTHPAEGWFLDLHQFPQGNIALFPRTCTFDHVF
jgi:hypothetical protein